MHSVYAWRILHKEETIAVAMLQRRVQELQIALHAAEAESRRLRYGDTPPCRVHDVYTWRVLEGGVRGYGGAPPCKVYPVDMTRTVSYREGVGLMSA